MILSVSRRTDIPAYYSEWLLNRLEDGYVLTRNPMNPSQISRIILSPENIDCIVFWTKDPLNMMDRLRRLDELGYPYYFQFTLTPYDTDYEKNLRDKKKIIQTFRELSTRIGRDRVLWRYDPIILNQQLTPAYHKEMFEYLCNELMGYTNICTFSFVDLYQKLNKQVAHNSIMEISNQDKYRLAGILSDISKIYGIKLQVCCEEIDLSGLDIRKAACIDQSIIEKTCNKILFFKKDKNQRIGCGCVQSVDIGVYNTCKNACIYCYANHSEASVMKNYSLHNPNSDILIGNLKEGEVVKERR